MRDRQNDVQTLFSQNRSSAQSKSVVHAVPTPPLLEPPLLLPLLPLPTSA